MRIGDQSHENTHHSAATMFKCAISTFRASKCSYLWLDDILDCIEQTLCNRKVHRVLKLLAVNCKRQSIEKIMTCAVLK